MIKKISFSISENMPMYGNKNHFELKKLSSIKDGDTANSSSWIFQTNHIGTHIDFPKHFCKTGKSLSDYPNPIWIMDKIGLVECGIDGFEKEIDKVSNDIEFLIWKSGFGEYRNQEIYWKEQPVIPSVFADLINQKFKNLIFFGFDMISLTSQLDKNEGKKIHNKFLCDYEILIIEDMNLKVVSNDEKINKVIVSALDVENADGSPCSVHAFI